VPEGLAICSCQILFVADRSLEFYQILMERTTIICSIGSTPICTNEVVVPNIE
jgi:hypothetical protein